MVSHCIRLLGKRQMRLTGLGTAVEAFLMDEEAIADLARRAVLAVLKAVLESMIYVYGFRRVGLVCEELRCGEW